MRTAAYNVDVASGLRFSTSVLAKQAPLALSNAAGARMCNAHSLFFVISLFSTTNEIIN